MYFLFKRMTEESAEELEEMAEKTGEAATSETGEGTLLEDGRSFVQHL